MSSLEKSSSHKGIYTFAMFSGVALSGYGAISTDLNSALTASDRSMAWGAKTELVDSYILSGQLVTFMASGLVQYKKSDTLSETMSSSERLRQYRYKSIERSFMKHSDGLPGNKMSYMSYMANVMCGLSFSDNISSYNKFDDTIDSVFSLDCDLTLTMSQFLDEKIDAPVVFSIHRGEDLLVSAEMRMEELEKTVNEVLESELTANV